MVRIEPFKAVVCDFTPGWWGEHGRSFLDHDPEHSKRDQLGSSQPAFQQVASAADTVFFRQLCAQRLCRGTRPRRQHFVFKYAG